jgi:hypothetical protein
MHFAKTALHLHRRSLPASFGTLDMLVMVDMIKADNKKQPGEGTAEEWRFWIP